MSKNTREVRLKKINIILHSGFNKMHPEMDFDYLSKRPDWYLDDLLLIHCSKKVGNKND